MSSRSANLSSLARYVLSRGWLHVILLCGTTIFLFPFVWMVGTSMKTDEEITNGRWMPSVPTFVAKSPYVLSAPELVKPLQVSAELWDRYSPTLLDETRRLVSQRLAADAPDRDEHIDSASISVMNRLTGRIDDDAWTAGEATVLDRYRGMLSGDVIDEALGDRLARFELRGLLLRTLDSRVFNLAESGPQWVVESGPGELTRDSSGGLFVRYDFANAQSAPVVLRKDFTFPVSVEDWHKLIVSYKGDSTWHGIESSLEVGGARWTGERPTYLRQSRPASILLQPITFEDDTLKRKVWTVMHLDGAPPAVGARQATLWLTLRPTSTSRAILAKVQYNYLRVVDAVPFWRYVANSLVLVLLCTVGTLFSSTFVAYAFARLRWPGRSVAFLLLLSTMMLPSQVTMIPSFMIWRTVGWYNTLNPVWVPAFLGSAFFIFLMVQQMKTIPRELEEAARIDGLNAVQSWWYIIVPLVKPAAAAVAIMAGMGAWNEFMGPLIYLRDQGRFPLSLGVFGIRADYSGSGIDWPLLMSCNVLMTLPVVLLFLCFQRYFVQGAAMSGIKG